jgi:hypothetical protein
MAAERRELIEQISSFPGHSHGVFGRFDFDKAGGHFLHDVRGHASLIQSLFEYEELYEIAFGKSTSGPEFRAHILEGMTKEGEHLFIMSFNDRQEDK